MALKYIEGDLLEVEADFIVHQINCLSVKAHGLAESIAKKYPWADRYAKRRQDGNRNLAIPEDRDLPGDVVVLVPPVAISAPYVVGLLGQYDFSSPLKYNRGLPLSKEDTAENREKWFWQALQKFAVIVNATQKTKIAFPERIGCGLAGGSWPKYIEMLKSFSELVSRSEIIIVKLKN